MLRYRLREAERRLFPCPKDLSPTLHALLMQRGIASEEEARRFLHPTADQLRDPMALSGMEAATERIRRAISDGERVCVYGDYDVDGVSASALLADYLRGTGLSVEVYLPSRHTEGYGLNETAVRMLARRCGLMVTVDCGVTSTELVALAKSLGMDCIVTDHHRPGETLPDCPVVNPLLNDYPFPFLCGAGVAFKLVQALGGVAAALEYVDIAALATVADVVPLTDENRVIVRLGLDRINRAPRPGLQALIDVAGMSEKKITAGNIAFQLGPRLNAGGRIGAAGRAHELLLTADRGRAAALAAELEEDNRLRRQLEQEILADAEAQLKDFNFVAHRALVLWGEGWNPGVIGLAASRLVEKYHYPTILLSADGEILTGSCRSIPGVDIHAALTAVQRYLIRYGGHKQAAGLTMEKACLEDFRMQLDRYLGEQVSPVCYIPDVEYDMSVSFDVLTEGFVAALEALQPTGFGNPAPVMRTVAAVIAQRRVGVDGAHLQMTLSQNSVHHSGIFFRGGALEDTLEGQVDVLYTPKLNTYQGRTSVQLEMKAVRPENIMSEISAKKQDEDDFQHDFLTSVLYNKRISFHESILETISPETLMEWLRESPQGTLVLTADMDVAAQLARRSGDRAPDLFVGEAPKDPRAFNALWAYPAEAVAVSYPRVVLAGFPFVPESFGGADVYRLEADISWRKLLPDVDQLRQVYVTARRLGSLLRNCVAFADLTHLLQAYTGYDSLCCAAALLTLHDMKLIALELDSVPARLTLNKMRKTEPETSQVFRTLCRWKD
ncbi:MAG: single-stranded-DNA-specific exonuclease RecJ [Christensenellales bacterium]|nr:single-stranded-DNA-specific exonuclease RecJ [Christensenellales bacterium]